MQAELSQKPQESAMPKGTLLRNHYSHNQFKTVMPHPSLIAAVYPAQPFNKAGSIHRAWEDNMTLTGPTTFNHFQFQQMASMSSEDPFRHARPSVWSQGSKKNDSTNSQT